MSGVLETGAWTAPTRLRWIADFLDLADKAISMNAYRGAQRDLRAWARWLDANGALAADLDLARVDLRLEATPSSQTFTHPRA